MTTAAATMLPPAPQQKQTLSDIAERIIAVLEESGGEVTDALDMLELQLEDKVAAYRIVILRLEAEAAANKQLEDEFAARKAAKQARADALEAQLLGQMQKLGRSNIKTAICTAYTQDSVSVEVPSNFCDYSDVRFVRTKKEPRLKELKVALEAGEAVPDAKLVKRTGLRFR